MLVWLGAGFFHRFDFVGVGYLTRVAWRTQIGSCLSQWVLHFGLKLGALPKLISWRLVHSAEPKVLSSGLKFEGSPLVPVFSGMSGLFFASMVIFVGC